MPTAATADAQAAIASSDSEQRQRRLAFVANIKYTHTRTQARQVLVFSLFRFLFALSLLLGCQPSRSALLCAPRSAWDALLAAAFFVRSLTCGAVKLWNVFAFVDIVVVWRRRLCLCVCDSMRVACFVLFALSCTFAHTLALSSLEQLRERASHPV